MSNRVVETVYRLRDRATEVLRRIRGGYKTSATEAERASHRIESANRRHRNSVQGVLAAVGRMRFAYFAIAGAVAGAVRGIAKFAKAASDQENAERRLETAIRNGTGATDEQIQKLKEQAKARQRVTRFGDEQTLSAQAQLATFKLNAEQIADLTPRVQDLAESQRRLGRENVDLESSAQLIGKALSGNAGELSRYGVILTDAQRETIRLGNANERVAALGEALDANFKGMATSLTDYEQAAQNSKAAAGDFMETLGSTITQNPVVTKALQSLTEWFDKMATAVAENSGAITRFVSGTVAGFRILKNTADIIFDAILLGANRLQRKILETGRSIASNLAKVTFGSARETLDQFVTDADKRLESLEKASDERFRKMGENVAEYIEAGGDLTNALTGQTNAQEEANEATREGAEAGNDAADAARDQAQAEEEKREALERTREIFKTLQLDYDQVETGIRQSTHGIIDSLAELATESEISLNALETAGRKALEEFNPDELKAFIAKLTELLDEGKVTEAQFEALTVSIREMGGELKAGGTRFDNLSAAIKEANSHDLTNLAREIRLLGESGELSEEQVQALFDSIEQARQAMREADRQQQESTESTQDLTEAQRQLGDEMETTGKRGGAVGKLIADVLGQLRDMSDAAADAVDRWVESQSKLRAPSDYLADLAKFGRELTAEFNAQVAQADELAGKVDQLSGYHLDAAESLVKYSSTFDLLPTEKMDALAGAIRNARSEMQRLQDETKRGVETLEDELLRLQGREDELEQRRMERRRREIELKLAAEDLDRESEKNLRKQLRLLTKIEEETERRRKQDQQEARQKEQERAGGGGSQPRPTKGGGAPQRIEIELKGDQGDPNARRLNPADLATLRRELTQSVLQQLRMEQSIGL